MVSPRKRVVRIETVNKTAQKNKKKNTGGAQKVSGETFIISSSKDTQKTAVTASVGRKFFLFLMGVF